MKLLPKEKQELNFKDWATGYSGIVGGNLKGKLWFCGIEYGGFDNELKFELPEENQQSYKGLPCWDEKTVLLDNIGRNGLKYDYKCAKLACLYFDLPIEEYKTYFNKKLYYHNGNTFKLNLYPLAFRNISAENWTELCAKKTGFSDKSSYQKWCQINRFSNLKLLVSKHKPDVLICTGKTFEEDFKKAFLINGNEDFISEVHTLDSKNRKFNFKFYMSGKTLVVITPHLAGPWGLNSDESIKILANVIKRAIK